MRGSGCFLGERFDPTALLSSYRDVPPPIREVRTSHEMTQPDYRLLCSRAMNPFAKSDQDDGLVVADGNWVEQFKLPLPTPQPLFDFCLSFAPMIQFLARDLIFDKTPMRLESGASVDRAHSRVGFAIPSSRYPGLRMAFVHLPQQGALQCLGETARTPRPSHCSEPLVNLARRSTVTRRLGQARDAPVRGGKHNEMMRVVNTVERAIPFVVDFDLPFYGRDLKTVFGGVGGSRFAKEDACKTDYLARGKGEPA